MNTDENAAAAIDADLYFPVHVKTLCQKFIAGPGEKIDGHDTIQVVGRTEGQPPLRLYLDSQSNLLLRLVRYQETPLGRIPTQVDYSDYRDADEIALRGAHGEEDPYTPILEAVLIACQRPVVRERFHGVEHNVVLVRTQRALAEPKYIGLLVVK